MRPEPTSLNTVKCRTMSNNRSGANIPATSTSCCVNAPANLPSDAATPSTVTGYGSFQAK